MAPAQTPRVPGNILERGSLGVDVNRSALSCRGGA
ncbi:unnamed protein product, partial [Gulo gulo]